MGKNLHVDWLLAQALLAKGLSTAAVAREMGLKPATLRKRIHRAGWSRHKKGSSISLLDRSQAVREKLAIQVDDDANALKKLTFRGGKRAAVTGQVVVAAAKVFAWDEGGGRGGDTWNIAILGRDAARHEPEEVADAQAKLIGRESTDAMGGYKGGPAVDVSSKIGEPEQTIDARQGCEPSNVPQTHANKPVQAVDAQQGSQPDIAVPDTNDNGTDTSSGARLARLRTCGFGDAVGDAVSSPPHLSTSLHKSC